MNPAMATSAHRSRSGTVQRTIANCWVSETTVRLPIRPNSMRPHITLITLGVDDLQRAVAFYHDGLGLPTTGIMGAEFEIGAVAFFDLDAGLKLALWPRKSLAVDSGLPLTPASPTSFSLAHNVGSESEVDAVMEQAKNAGATVVKVAQKTFWGGYAGYFQDPDGHLWEVAYNPEMSSQNQTSTAPMSVVTPDQSGSQCHPPV
jgi:uncharacterized glyoxalase superfamily protein PhnB